MCVQNRGAVEGVGGVCSHRVSTIDGTTQKPAIVVPVQYTQRESLVNLLGRGREEERLGCCSLKLKSDRFCPNMDIVRKAKFCLAINPLKDTSCRNGAKYIF